MENFESTDVEWNGVRFVGAHGLTAMSEFIHLSAGLSAVSDDKVVVRTDRNAAEAVVTRRHKHLHVEIQLRLQENANRLDGEGAYIDEQQGCIVVQWRGLRHCRTLPNRLCVVPHEKKLAYVSAYLAFIIRRG